jgi:hypothetical protein
MHSYQKRNPSNGFIGLIFRYYPETGSKSSEKGKLSALGALFLSHNSFTTLLRIKKRNPREERDLKKNLASIS